MAEQMKICAYCGVKYNPKSAGAGRKYCSIDCGYKNNLLQMRKNYAKKNEKRRKAAAQRRARKAAADEKDAMLTEREREHKRKTEELARITAEAKAAGMSYGQYVAMKEGRI